QPHEGPGGYARAPAATPASVGRPSDPHSRRAGAFLYPRCRWGSLAELSMLDLRSYRTESPNRLDGRAIDQTGTMTGAEQFDWLARGLNSSTARWNVLGNSVMVAPVPIPPLDHRTLA